MLKENGDYYDGTFERGRFKEGKVRIREYEGDIKNFTRWGVGKYTDPKGNKYEGCFENNKYHG